jgi:hypothetical protein
VADGAAAAAAPGRSRNEVWQAPVRWLRETLTSMKTRLPGMAPVVRNHSVCLPLALAWHLSEAIASGLTAGDGVAGLVAAAFGVFPPHPAARTAAPAKTAATLSLANAAANEGASLVRHFPHSHAERAGP